MRLLVFLWIICHSCASSRPASGLCNIKGAVHIDGLDGCGPIIVTRSGERLLPVNADGYGLTADSKVIFSYSEFEGMSNCMAEDKLITLTCLQKINKVSCEPKEEITAESWLGDQVNLHAAIRIERSEMGNEYFYQVMYAENDYSWYDCHGQLICENKIGCHLSGGDLTNPTVIFLAHR